MHTFLRRDYAVESKEIKVVGPGLLSMLTVLFVGLKLGGVINWSWLWVLAPTWIPFAIAIVAIGIFIAATIGVPLSMIGAMSAVAYLKRKGWIKR